MEAITKYPVTEEGKYYLLILSCENYLYKTLRREIFPIGKTGMEDNKTKS